MVDGNLWSHFVNLYVMKKVLIYATGGQGLQEGSQLEELIVNYKKGNEILYLTCGSCLGGCLENPLFNSKYCRFCSYFLRHRAMKGIGNSACVHSVNEYFTDDIKALASEITFDYNSVDELKSLEYKGVNVGFGAVSSYISLTRNMNPDFTLSIRKYIDKLLHQQVVLTEILEKVISSFKPDLIIFHNGRFAQYKPLLDVAKKNKIDFICTETLVKSDGIGMKNYYYNDIPHNAYANKIKYDNFWNSYSHLEERDIVACSFFENRRYGKYAGDKIYTKDQLYGMLPEGWDDERDNIVIFNSSEDEFCAINKEVDKANIFGNQLNGIKSIIERYQGDDSKHFYLRIHPNLMNIPYDYHTDLYRLSYDNLTIIPPESPISSYSLMDKANKVIVFGSTMGIESAYWKKPVICLGYALYSLLGAVYIPKNETELWQLIEDDGLLPKYSDEILKYGLYYMSDKHEKFHYVNNRVVYRKLCKKQWKCFAYMTFCHSQLLYKLIQGRIVKFAQRYNLFECVPC